MRRRRSTYTPPRNVQPQRQLLARDNSVELAFAQRQMTITPPPAMLCVTTDDNSTVYPLQLLWLDNQPPSNS
eukprot:6491169-Amphidinium_carterae.2